MGLKDKFRGSKTLLFNLLVYNTWEEFLNYKSMVTTPGEGGLAGSEHGYEVIPEAKTSFEKARDFAMNKILTRSIFPFFPNLRGFKNGDDGSITLIGKLRQHGFELNVTVSKDCSISATVRHSLGENDIPLMARFATVFGVLDFKKVETGDTGTIFKHEFGMYVDGDANLGKFEDMVLEGVEFAARNLVDIAKPN